MNRKAVLQGDDLALQGEMDLLIRLFLNLLDNAIKFTPAGGQVTVRLIREPENMAFMVRDTGIGIIPNELDLVFNRFHRGRNAAEYPGSGLGLAIVKAVIEQHRGTVTAENTVQGTIFLVRIPILEDA